MNQDSKQLLANTRQSLSTIFGNSFLVDEFSKNADFQLVVEKLIKIHQHLEIQLAPELVLTDKYIANFERLSNRKIDFTKMVISQDLDDLHDEINYVSVFAKNTFSRPLTDFTVNLANDVNLSDDQPLAIQPTVDGTPPGITLSTDGKTVDVNEQPIKGEKIPAAAFKKRNQASNFVAEEDPNNKNVGFNPNLFNQKKAYQASGYSGFNPVIQQLANQRLQVEILIGKVYRWNEKPRAVLLLQYFALVFSILFFVINGITIIVWAVASANGLQIANPLDPTDLTKAISITPRNLFTFIVGPIVMVIGGIVLTLRYFNDSQGKLSPTKMRRLQATVAAFLKDQSFPKVNDNLRYHLQTSTIIFVLVAYVIFNFSPFGGVFSQIRVLTNPDDLHAGTNNAGGIRGSSEVLAIYVSTIISLVAYAPLVIILIFAYLINPKVDFERLTALTEQYAKEAEAASRSGNISGGIGSDYDGSYDNGPFGSNF